MVFDTSTLVSAALRIGSVPYRALLLAFQACDVCVSELTLAELEAVLGRAKFDRYLNLEERQVFINTIRRNAQLFSVSQDVAATLNPRCRDAADNKFLALALTAEADSIVSSDEDLLLLHPWQGIQIVKPSEFVESFGKRAGEQGGR